MVKGFLPILSLSLFSVVLAACGGGSGGDAAPAAAAEADPGRDLKQTNPWLGSWQHIAGANCEERLTLYDNGEFVLNSADNIQRGVYDISPQAEFFLLDLNFQRSNQQTDCSGQSIDNSGEIAHYRIALQPKSSIELLTRLMPTQDDPDDPLQSNSQSPTGTPEEIDINTQWSAVGDQIRSLQDPYVTDYATPYKTHVVEHLDRIAFELTYQYNGYLYPVTTPVLLFNDGQLCRDGRMLISELSVAEHRERYPEFWSQWREEGGKLQLLQEDGWQDAAFDTPAVPFTPGQTTQGSFTQLSGYVIPGTSSGAWHFAQYDFFNSTEFASSSGTSVSSGLDFTDPASIQVYLANFPADQHGSYEFDGYHLTIRYASGEIRHHVAVKDDQEIGQLMWLDGQAYQREQ